MLVNLLIAAIFCVKLLFGITLWLVLKHKNKQLSDLEKEISYLKRRMLEETNKKGSGLFHDRL